MEELVNFILKPPVMAYPNFEKPSVVHVDVDVLYQVDDDDQMHVIAYGSRTLTPAKEYHLNSGKL